jgi:hypothetical protein
LNARPGRRAFGPLLVIGALALAWLVFGHDVPEEQTVHIVLGDLAPRVTEARIRYTPVSARGEAVEPLREATFHYAADASDGIPAPRIITHELRVPGDEYTIEIDVIKGNDRASVSRRVKLGGRPVSIDVRESLK